MFSNTAANPPMASIANIVAHYKAPQFEDIANSLMGVCGASISNKLDEDTLTLELLGKEIPEERGDALRATDGTPLFSWNVEIDLPYNDLPAKSPSVAPTEIPSPTLQAKPKNYSAGGLAYYVDGEANGQSLRAKPDTGAANSFLSASATSSLKAELQPNTESEVLIGSGKKIRSPGTVSIKWKFQGDPQAHELTCIVLPTMVGDLILGRPFLELTDTLVKFSHRIKKMAASVFKSGRQRLSMNLIGTQGQRLWGYLHGNLVGAVPDLGSDVVLMSPECAERAKLEVHRRSTSTLELEFADGSIQYTSGIIKNATWTFDEDGRSLVTDFYILDGLPVDIVLSNEILLDYDVYSNYRHRLVDAEPSVAAELFNITLIGKYSHELEELEIEARRALLSPDAFSASMIRAETRRRDKIRDEILKLDDGKQAEAWANEKTRREQWKAMLIHARGVQYVSPGQPGSVYAQPARVVSNAVRSAGAGGLHDLSVSVNTPLAEASSSRIAVRTGVGALVDEPSFENQAADAADLHRPSVSTTSQVVRPAYKGWMKHMARFFGHYSRNERGSTFEIV